MTNLFFKAPSSACHELFPPWIEKQSRTCVAPDQIEDLPEKDVQQLVDILKCLQGLNERSDFAQTLRLSDVR